MVAIKGPSAKGSGKRYLKRSGGSHGDVMEWRGLSQEKRKALKDKYGGDVGKAVRSVVGKPGGDSKFSERQQAYGKASSKAAPKAAPKATGGTPDSRQAEKPKSEAGGSPPKGSTTTPKRPTANKAPGEAKGSPPPDKAKAGNQGGSQPRYSSQSEGGGRKKPDVAPTSFTPERGEGRGGTATKKAVSSATPWGSTVSARPRAQTPAETAGRAPAGKPQSEKTIFDAIGEGYAAFNDITGTSRRVAEDRANPRVGGMAPGSSSPSGKSYGTGSHPQRAARKAETRTAKVAAGTAGTRARAKAAARYVPSIVQPSPKRPPPRVEAAAERKKKTGGGVRR